MEINSLKLVYFSATGTTKKIVQEIGRGIGYDVSDVVDITKPGARKQRLQTSENELLIIGVPVYEGRVQDNALNWLQTIEAHNTPTACIVVYGNRAYDDALIQIKNILIKRKCVPIACAAFVAQHTFSSHKTPIAHGRPDADDLNQAKLFGENIRKKMFAIESISSFADVDVPGDAALQTKLHMGNVVAKGPRSLYERRCFFLIDVAETCTQCGICADVCPVGAIDPENSATVDQDKCIQLSQPYQKVMILATSLYH
jgi:flavodoxin/NAD-dependent dihydropyrimidine dehydrogenase PreA subunit